jgi:hypothetical protein
VKQERSSVLYKRSFALLVVLAFLVAGSLFFWYEYRPGMVREKCSLEAEKRADNDPFVYEIIYRHCLRTHGIEYFEQEEQKERISEQSPLSGPQRGR